MIGYMTGLGQIWVGARPPENRAYNILWLKPAETAGYWELRAYNQHTNTWEYVITAKIDSNMEERIKALEEGQKEILLKIDDIESEIALLDSTVVKKVDIVQEQGDAIDKVMSQDATTRAIKSISGGGSGDPDIESHNTDPNAHEDIRNLIESNTSQISINSSNISKNATAIEENKENINKSVLLPTYSSENSTLTFKTHGGQTLSIPLTGDGGTQIPAYTITDFKSVKPDIYKLPKGSLFTLTADPSTVQNGPSSLGKSGNITGLGMIASNSSPGKDSTIMTITYIIQGTTGNLIYNGTVTVISTSTISIKWSDDDTSSKASDTVIISDFKNSEWTSDYSDFGSIFIKSNSDGVTNGPESGDTHFYMGYAQIINSDGTNKTISYFVQSYPTVPDADEVKLYQGLLAVTSATQEIKWYPVVTSSSGPEEITSIRSTVITNYKSLSIELSKYPINTFIPITNAASATGLPDEMQGCNGYGYAIKNSLNEIRVVVNFFSSKGEFSKGFYEGVYKGSAEQPAPTTYWKALFDTSGGSSVDNSLNMGTKALGPFSKNKITITKPVGNNSETQSVYIEEDINNKNINFYGALIAQWDDVDASDYVFPFNNVVCYDLTGNNGGYMRLLVATLPYKGTTYTASLGVKLMGVGEFEFLVSTPDDQLATVTVDIVGAKIV